MVSAMRHYNKFCQNWPTGIKRVERRGVLEFYATVKISHALYRIKVVSSEGNQSAQKKYQLFQTRHAICQFLLHE